MSLRLLKGFQQAAKPVRAAIVMAGMFAAVLAILFALRLLKTTKLTAPPQTPKAVVQITANGFVPATLKVKSGTEVTWINTDSKPHKVAANPHPAHDSVPGLESQELAPGKTYHFIFKDKGSYGYHDEAELTQNGTILVNPL